MDAVRVAPLCRAGPPQPTGSANIFRRQGRASSVRGRNGASRRGRGGASRAAWDGDLIPSALSPARAGGPRGGLSQSPVLGPPWGPSRGGRAGGRAGLVVQLSSCSSRVFLAATPRGLQECPGRSDPTGSPRPPRPLPASLPPRNAPIARRSPTPGPPTTGQVAHLPWLHPTRILGVLCVSFRFCSSSAEDIFSIDF